MPSRQNPPADKERILTDILVQDNYGTFFGVSKKVYQDVWNKLRSEDGNSVTYVSMEIGADPDVFNPIRDFLQRRETDENISKELKPFINRYLNGPQKIPNYGGGLGILAGDTLKSFADNQLPVAAISLLYRKGYFSQLVDSHIGQIVWSRTWDPENTPGLYLLNSPENHQKPLTIAVPFYDRNDNEITAYAHLWMKMEINHELNHFVPEILLDFSIPETPEWIRKTAFHLYDSSTEIAKAIQRRLLGGGVLPAMDALGITSRTIHLNEQHGAVVILQLIMQWLQKHLGPDFRKKATASDLHNAAEDVAQKLVYTIHTPVMAGHDRFSKEMYRNLGNSFCEKILELFANDPANQNAYNFTRLAMAVNRTTNAVSRLHKKVTQRQFPQFHNKITTITNGVHHLTWISAAKAECYDSFPEFTNWRQDPGVFSNAAKIKDNNRFRNYLVQAWQTDTRILINYVNDMLTRHRSQMYETWINPPNYLSHLEEGDRSLHPETFTIGFARRFSTYKRADLIFNDLDRLCRIITEFGKPMNFLFAGKAHPSDEPGKSIIKLVLDLQEDLYRKSNGMAKLIFIPDYDMQIAKIMVAGVHAWLNSPKRPLEASGTSGMKAALNAVPNISILDGWWDEGYHQGQTGWKIGVETLLSHTSLSENPDDLLYDVDAETFYQLLPDILESFYGQTKRAEYIDKCIMNIVLNCPIFNTHRMIAEYVDRYSLNLTELQAKKMSRLRKLYESDE